MTMRPLVRRVRLMDTLCTNCRLFPLILEFDEPQTSCILNQLKLDLMRVLRHYSSYLSLRVVLRSVIRSVKRRISHFSNDQTDFGFPYPNVCCMRYT